MSKYFTITILIILFVLLALPQIVFARGFVPCGGEGEEPCNICHVFVVFKGLLDGIGFVVVAWAVIFIIAGGIVIITSAGAPEKVSTGKKMITYAISGIIIVFTAWLIMSQIMVILVGEKQEQAPWPWPWHRIECVPSEPVVPPSTAQNYCVCQEPLTTRGSYTLIKATALTDAATCEQECVFNNRSTYCNIAAVSPDSMKCLSELELNGTDARCLKRAYTYKRIGQTCYSTNLECANKISIYESCDNADCKCYDSDDIPGVIFPCQTNQFAVFKKTEDMSKYDIGFCGNVLTCQQQLEPAGNNCWWCALGSAGCGQPIAEDWCQRSAPAGSENWTLNPPPGGAKPEQKGDASAQLTSFINCMYSQLPNLKINSISSNVLCNDPSCDISQAGVCGHAANSCHFGGANCAGQSYAVDFDTSVGCSDIKTAALQCDSTAWVNWGDSHTHVSVNNTACGCNESGSGTSCQN